MKIINQIKKWLNKPYSYREELDFQISLSFIIGFFVFLILYGLKPYGLGNLNNNLLYYFAGYGIISTTALLFFFFLITPAFPNYFSDKNWTIKKEIITISSITLIVGSIAWIYHIKVSIEPINNSFTYINFILRTIGISIFPLILYIYLCELFLTKNRNRISLEIKNKVQFKGKNIIKNKLITIISSNKKNQLKFKLSELIYIASEGNYACFFIHEKENITEKIIRVQLQAVEKELNNYKEIIRFHKSYIVNTKHITDISGNARGYYLHLKNLDKKIPVSRKFKKEELIALISKK